MASGHGNTGTSNNYLLMGSYYWTMSPSHFSGGEAMEGAVNSPGKFDLYYYVIDFAAVRPVLSLKADALQYSETSNGTKDYPFVVE